jgi:hypothetical protein
MDGIDDVMLQKMALDPTIQTFNKKQEKGNSGIGYRCGR